MLTKAINSKKITPHSGKILPGHESHLAVCGVCVCFLVLYGLNMLHLFDVTEFYLQLFVMSIIKIISILKYL